MAPLHIFFYFKSWNSALNFMTLLALPLSDYISVLSQAAILETYLKEKKLKIVLLKIFSNRIVHV